MLKITVYDRPTSWWLQLEGKLAGAWITAVENTLRSAPQRDSGKHLEIDLTDVTSVGEVGKHLLTLMHRVGAHFIAAGVVMKALIQEITGETTGTLSRGQRSWKRVRNLVCLLALLIIVHDVSLLAEDVPAAPIRLTLKDAVTLGAETKSLYDAGYGRNPGVNVITQSGTNVFRVLPTGWLPCAEADATGLFRPQSVGTWQMVARCGFGSTGSRRSGKQTAVAHRRCGLPDNAETSRALEENRVLLIALADDPRLLTVKIHVEAI